MDSFVLDEMTFTLGMRSGRLRERSTESNFVLVKSAPSRAFYEAIAGDPPRTIMQLGILEGGSLVYFDKLFHPEKIVGIDARRESVPALDRYQEDNPHIVTYYGRAQDAPGAAMALRSNFPKGVDMIVDDATHLYGPSLKSFETLFPFVKPGGRYVIEDWGWSIRREHQDEGSIWYNQPSLANLVLNMVLMTASSSVISAVEVNGGVACITKGRGVLPASGLSLAGKLRGRLMPEL